MQKAKNGNFEHMLPQKAIREVGASRRRTFPEYQSGTMRQELSLLSVQRLTFIPISGRLLRGSQSRSIKFSLCS
jgi:hypothetical protein